MATQIEPMYVIVNQENNKLYWNNEDGWGSSYTADLFTEDEKNRLNLPVEGEWLRTYTVHDVLKAEISLYPMRCLNCGSIQVAFYQYMRDAHCEKCGYWQVPDAPF